MNLGIALISCTVIICGTYFLSLVTKKGMELAKDKNNKEV